jgi:hypothetical protein
MLEIMMFKNVKGLEKAVEKLEKEFGLCKVNLVHEEGMNEGIWAVPIDADSKAKLDSDVSRDEYAFVRLCNAPLGWNDLTWGGLVRVKTSGDQRALGHLNEQNVKEIKEDRANLVAICEEASKNATK